MSAVGKWNIHLSFTYLCEDWHKIYSSSNWLKGRIFIKDSIIYKKCLKTIMLYLVLWNFIAKYQFEIFLNATLLTCANWNSVLVNEPWIRVQLCIPPISLCCVCMLLWFQFDRFLNITMTYSKFTEFWGVNPSPTLFQ